MVQHKGIICTVQRERVRFRQLNTTCCTAVCESARSALLQTYMSVKTLINLFHFPNT
jgi:hypothetical protein